MRSLRSREAPTAPSLRRQTMIRSTRAKCCAALEQLARLRDAFVQRGRLHCLRSISHRLHEATTRGRMGHGAWRMFGRGVRGGAWGLATCIWLRSERSPPIEHCPLAIL